MDTDIPEDAKHHFKPEAFKDRPWTTRVHFTDTDWRKWSNAGKIMDKFQALLVKSLNKKHTIAYKGRIPQGDVSVFSTYKPASMYQDPKTPEFNAAREKTLKTYKKFDGK